MEGRRKKTNVETQSRLKVSRKNEKGKKKGRKMRNFFEKSKKNFGSRHKRNFTEKVPLKKYYFSL